MSEFPDDIKKDAEEAVAGFMGWIEGGNTTASLSEHAVAGLKHSFASAILAERQRCKEEEFDDLVMAFKRGVTWQVANTEKMRLGPAVGFQKAAFDYADYHTSPTKIQEDFAKGGAA